MLTFLKRMAVFPAAGKTNASYYKQQSFFWQAFSFFDKGELSAPGKKTKHSRQNLFKMLKAAGYSSGVQSRLFSPQVQS